jgi:hypothetical protein
MIMPQSSPVPENQDAASIASVVAKLADFLVKYLEDAGKLGISVDAAQVAAAIDEAIRRCQTKQPGGPADESVTAFFLDGLSAALVDEQQGVYEKQKNADGEEVYIVVGDDVWVQCLTALRAAAKTAQLL